SAVFAFSIWVRQASRVKNNARRKTIERTPALLRRFIAILLEVKVPTKISKQALELHAHVGQIAGDDDFHRRRRGVLSQPEIELALPLAAAGHLDAADRVTAG